MLQVFDPAAARQALARRMLACPDCRGPLRPWGRARARTVRGPGGALVTVRPDRARCTRCQVTHVVLSAGLLPRRSCTAALIGQALLAAARGDGHRRIATRIAVPAGTVRGWVRRARGSAGQLRALGVRTVVLLNPDALPAAVFPDPLAGALDVLGAAARALGDRFAVPCAGPWARVNVLTRGQLLAPAPPG